MEHYLDSELIILEIEKYPYLNDKRHSDFKNRELKRDAWMAVTKNVLGEKWDKMDEKRKSNVGQYFNTIYLYFKLQVRLLGVLHNAYFYKYTSIVHYYFLFITCF